jgi:hypothetical protein
MSTPTTAERRSALTRRAYAGTVAAYVREESSRVTPAARPAARPAERPASIRTGVTPPRGPARRRGGAALARRVRSTPMA